MLLIFIITASVFSIDKQDGRPDDYLEDYWNNLVKKQKGLSRGYEKGLDLGGIQEVELARCGNIEYVRRKREQGDFQQMSHLSNQIILNEMDERGRNDELTFGHIPYAMMAGHPVGHAQPAFGYMDTEARGWDVLKTQIWESPMQGMVEDIGVYEETREIKYGQYTRILKMSNSTMRYDSKKLILAKLK